MRRSLPVVAAVAVTVIAGWFLTGCGAGDDAAPPPTTATEPNQAVDGAGTGEVGGVPDELAAVDTELAEGDLMRLDVPDCVESCARLLVVSSDGSFRLRTGAGEDLGGRFDDATFGPVADALVVADFELLRHDTADACEGRGAGDTLARFQFRVGDGVEHVDACGIAPAGSALLTGLQVLAATALGSDPD